MKKILLIITVCFCGSCSNSSPEQTLLGQKPFIIPTPEQTLKCQESHLSNEPIYINNPITRKPDTSADELYSVFEGTKFYNDALYFKKKGNLMSYISMSPYKYLERKMTTVEWENIISKFNNIGFWCIEPSTLKSSGIVFDGGGFNLGGKKGKYQHGLSVQDPHYDDASTKAKDALNGNKLRIETLVNELLKISEIDSIKYPIITYDYYDIKSIVKVMPNEKTQYKEIKVYANNRLVQPINNVWKIKFERYGPDDRLTIICIALTSQDEKIYYRATF